MCQADTYRLSVAGEWLTSVFSVDATDDDKLTVVTFDVDVASDDTDTMDTESVVDDSLQRRASSCCCRFNSSRYL